MNPHNFPWNRQVQLPSLEALAQAQAQALQVQVAQAQMLAQAQAAWVFHRQIKTHVWYIETRHKLVKSYKNLHEIRFTEQISLNLENIYIHIYIYEEHWGTVSLFFSWIRSFSQMDSTIFCRFWLRRNSKRKPLPRQWDFIGIHWVSWDS